MSINMVTRVLVTTLLHEYCVILDQTTTIKVCLHFYINKSVKAESKKVIWLGMGF